MIGSQNPLSDAISRGAGLVMSLPLSAGLTHHKSQFLSEEPGGVWVRVPDAGLVDQVIGNQASVGVTFKTENVRRIFVTRILRREANHPLPHGGCTDAVMLAHPGEIKSVQRRSHYRVRILPGSGLTFDCWIITRHADLKERPLPSQRVKLELRDISLGGAGIILLPSNGKPGGLSFDDRLRVQVKLNGIELLVEGRVRAPDSVIDGAVKTGIRFHFLDDGVDARLKVSQLARIIAQLELQQVKAIRKEADQLQTPTVPPGGVPATIAG